jgi:ribosomal-protein-alanine N-acetyltransferase
MNITLRKTTPEDLPELFVFQQDEDAIHLAAFTPVNQGIRSAYLEKYTPFLSNPTIHMQTILADGAIIGSIAKFEIEGEAEISYWIDKKFWGKGVTSIALAEFLKLEKMRPIFGRVAFDNIGSQRVLEKCGFTKIGTDKGFANARQAEIEEYIYKLP